MIKRKKNLMGKNEIPFWFLTVKKELLYTLDGRNYELQFELFLKLWYVQFRYVSDILCASLSAIRKVDTPTASKVNHYSIKLCY